MTTYTLETVPCPLKLTCTVSGKVTMYTSREYILGKIQQAGSLEALLANYVCKAARGGQKPAKAAKAPTGRTWKGEEIIKKEEKTQEVPKDEKPVEMMHNTFKFDGGLECNVYSPKASSENLSHQTFDYRRKDKKETCVENGN